MDRETAIRRIEALLHEATLEQLDTFFRILRGILDKQ